MAKHRVSFFSTLLLPAYDICVFVTWEPDSALLQALWEETVLGTPGTRHYRENTKQGSILQRFHLW